MFRLGEHFVAVAQQRLDLRAQIGEQAILRRRHRIEQFAGFGDARRRHEVRAWQA